MTEILGDAAEYFTPEDPASLGSCVERIIYNSSIAFEKANKAFKISQNYTWKKCAEETSKIYKSLI